MKQRDLFRSKDVVLFLVIIMMICSIYVVVWILQNRATQKNEQLMISLYQESIKNYIESRESLILEDESRAEKILYTTLSAIRNELTYVDASALSEASLNRLKNQFELSDLAILEKVGQDIVITASTDPREIGLKTSNWGYWHRAFEALFKGASVEANRGLQIGNFWVGPRSYKYLDYQDQKKYYKFAYIHNLNGDYLINAILAEEEYNHATTEINDYLETIVQKNPLIQQLVVIDLPNFKRYIENRYNRIEEPFVKYGRISMEEILSLSNYILDEDLKEKEERALVSLPDGTYLAINPIDEETMIATVFSAAVLGKQKDYFLLEAGILFLGTAILCLAAYRYFYLYKQALFQEKEKIEKKELQDSIFLRLPGIVMRLHQQADIMVEYLGGYEGELFLKGLQIDKKAKLSEVIPKALYHQMQKGLREAFDGKKVSFEAEIMGKKYDVSLIPTEEADKIIFFAYDIYKYINEQGEESYMAYHDILTGIGNRAKFEKDFALHQKKWASFYVLYMDINKFKEINDRYDHSFGDRVLREIGQQFSSFEAEGFSFYRFGGDEFVALSREMKLEVFLKKIKRIEHLIESIHEIEGKKFEIGISIGACRYPDNGTLPEELLSIADKEMYRVKHIGRSSHKIATYDN